MGIKHDGTYAKATLSSLGALAFDAYQGVVIWRLATAGQMEGPRASIIVLGAFTGTLWIYANVIIGIVLFRSLRQRLRLEQAVRAAAERDGQRAPEAAVQPVRSRALANGGLLELEIRRPRVRGANRVAVLVLQVFLPVLLISQGEGLMFRLLPGLRDSAFNIFATRPPAGTPPSTPSTLDWAVAAFPVVYALVTMALPLFAAAPRWERITADDHGITLARARRRMRFIPWSDILVFQRTAETRSDAPRGTYLLRGRRHALTLTLHDEPVNAMRHERRNPFTEKLEYPAGYFRYDDDARRLLATIAARGMVPLRLVLQPHIAAHRGAVRNRLALLDADEAQALPIAPATLQPAAAAIERSKALAGEVRLGIRLPWISVAMVASLMSGLGIVRMYATLLLPFQSRGAGKVPYYTLIPFVFGVAAFVSLGIFYGFTSVRTRNPLIIANQHGLMSRPWRSSASLARDISWPEVRAWAVMLPPAGSASPPMYVVQTTDRRIAWPEPPEGKLAGRGIRGDRRAAYRVRAELPHALIAAKTGLPLRVIEPLTSPAGE
jgi:hypothetical protein